VDTCNSATHSKWTQVKPTHSTWTQVKPTHNTWTQVTVQTNAQYVNTSNTQYVDTSSSANQHTVRGHKVHNCAALSWLTAQVVLSRYTGTWTQVTHSTWTQVAVQFNTQCVQYATHSTHSASGPLPVAEEPLAGGGASSSLMMPARPLPVKYLWVKDVCVCVYVCTRPVHCTVYGTVRLLLYIPLFCKWWCNHDLERL
jgi:hypothetical protein